jgi:hypothetical protein
MPARPIVSDGQIFTVKREAFAATPLPGAQLRHAERRLLEGPQCHGTVNA